jgi:hypothetical protein
MPLVPTPARLKLLQACDQRHSSRTSTFLTSLHCKFRPNTEGALHLSLTNEHPSTTVRCLRFRQKFTLEDAIGSHACSLEANTRVTNVIPLGSSLLLPVDAVHSVQTRKVVLAVLKANPQAATQQCTQGRTPLHVGAGRTVRVFHHGFCCVRVSAIGLQLLYGALSPGSNLHSRMPLDPTHVRLKLLHACGQCIPLVVHCLSPLSTASHRYHHALCRNAQGTAITLKSVAPRCTG